MKKKIISAFLALALLGGASLPAYASEKEEVIYIKAKADGSINNIYAVNSFEGGEITDYGEYSFVKLMNIEGKITQNGDEIRIVSAENEKIYYQGTLENAEIPWNISLRYFLDGKELSADEIAGKSGRLEIKILICENKKCARDFYDSYSLQCTFTLDTKICKNIKAPGATVANEGSKKQITYTALAGSGLDRTVTADVTNFEMPSAQIVGIRMNLGLDIDYDGNLSDLKNGAKELDDGANELYNGAKEVKDGASDLKDGIEKLRDGIDTAQKGLEELNSKSSELKNGSEEIKNALITIRSSLSAVSEGTDELEQLTAASAQISSGIDSLCSGIATLQSSLSVDGYKTALRANGLDVDALREGNDQAINQLTSQIAELKAALAQIQNLPEQAEQASALSAQIAQLETIAQLLSGNNAMISATETYMTAVSGATEQLLSGANELNIKYAEFDAAICSLADYLSKMMADMSLLSDGINTLASEYAKLDDGIIEYTDGVKKLYDGFAEISDGARELVDGGIALSEGTEELVSGAEELKDGTGKLRKETDLIDSAATEELSDILDSMTKEYETVSFISDKNTEVSSVQFVINTEAVEIPEPEATAEKPAEKLNFWQKLLRLFGLY
ncbi:MAG: hypothetical protein ACI4QZ_06340 [Eubacteriales bacterium]